MIMATTSDWSTDVNSLINTTAWSTLDPINNTASPLRNGTELETGSTTSTSTTLSIVYICFGVLGLLGNSLVVVVLGTSPKLRKTITNIFIISQSALDALVSLFLIASAQGDSVVPYQGVAGDVYCKLWLSKFPLWWVMLASTYNLVALSVERYLNVVHPIWHKLWFSNNVAYGTIAFVVIAAFIHQCYTFIPTTVVLNGLCYLYYKWPSQVAREIYGISVVTLRFFIPLFVFVYTYSRIAYVIHKKVKSKQQANASAAQDASAQKWSRGRKNTIKTMAIVSLAYLLCWAINQIYFFMFNVGWPADYTSDLYHSSVALVYINCTINPFIYALKYEQFITAAKKLFCPHLPPGANNSVGDSTVN